MNANQEPKYKIENGRLVNRQSNEPIPDDEPVFILRARDIHAVDVLERYLSLVATARGPHLDVEHYRAVKIRQAQFQLWAAKHPDRMKFPDTKLTNDWDV